MAAVTDKELFSALRSGDYSNVYWFYGHDIDSVEKCAKQLVKKIVGKDGEAYNLHSFQGDGLDVGELMDSCEMLPFFAERQCCTVCDINAEQLSAEDNKALLSLVADLPKETVLIFYNTSADICGGKKCRHQRTKSCLTPLQNMEPPAVLNRKRLRSCRKPSVQGLQSLAAQFSRRMPHIWQSFTIQIW